MNEYGMIDIDTSKNLYDRNDLDEIHSGLNDNGSVVFSFSGDMTTSYIVHLSINFKKIGIMPWGGNPSGAVFMGLVGRGCFFFDPEREMFPSYLSEKIELRSAEAKIISDFWNQLFCLGEYANKVF